MDAIFTLIFLCGFVSLLLIGELFAKLLGYNDEWATVSCRSNGWVRTVILHSRAVVWIRSFTT